MTTPPSVAVVEGEAGVGKSRLIAEALDHPESATRRRLTGRSHQIHEPFPLGAIVEAVRGLGEDLRGMPLGQVTGALRPLLPEFASRLPLAPEPLDDRVAERHQVFRGLVDLLRSAGPIVLVLEDLHWADDQTTDFLTYLVTQPPSDLSLVLSYRGEDVAPGLRTITARAMSSMARSHLVIEPLTESETGELAAAILDIDQVSGDFARFLWERTSGLPFAIEEVLALVQTRGQLIQRGGTWSRRALHELEVPEGVVVSTLERFAGLSSDASRLVEAAAVLSLPQPAQVLLSMRAGEGNALDALDLAIGAGMLVERNNKVGLRHLLAAQAVYDRMSTPRRQMLHRQAASALQTLEPVPHGQVAHHLRQSGRLVEWSQAAELAADQAVDVGNEDEAVRLLCDVVRDAPLSPHERGRLAAKLAWAALDTLHAREIVEPVSDALDADLPASLRGELRFLLAIALGQAGEDPHRQRQLLLNAVPDLQSRPDLHAWAMVALSLTTPPGVPLVEDLRWLRQAIELADQIADPLHQVFVLGKAGSVLVDIGDPAWSGIAEQVREITADSPRQRREVNAHYSLGVAASYAGHLQTADSLLSKGLQAPAAQANGRLTMLLRSALAVQRFLAGNWTGLKNVVDQLLAEVADYATSRMDLELVAGHLALAEGDLDNAHALLERSTHVAVDLSAYEVIPLAAAGWARVTFARGDSDAALAGVNTLLDVLDAKGVWVPAVAWALPDVTEALVATGRQDEAAQFLDRAAKELGALDAPLLSPSLHHAQGVIASAAGECAKAANQFLSAMEEYQRIPSIYPRAIATERAAKCLFEEDLEDGRRLLHEAAQAYDVLGATWDRTRAAGLARGHGIALPRAHHGGRRGYGDELSPREYEVATLAATGRTNNEIARELFISINTVEKHLGAVMRKLDMRSRTELAHRLRSGSNNGGSP